MKHIFLAITDSAVVILQKKKKKRLRENILSMLSCGALERSNNPYIKSIVEPFASKSERDLRYVYLIGKKILKND